MKRALDEFRRYPMWLRWLLPAAAAVFTVSLITQMTLFPDNPVVPRDGGYVGKYGAPRSAADYERFTRLNRTILVSALALFAAFACTLGYRDRGREGDPR